MRIKYYMLLSLTLSFGAYASDTPLPTKSQDVRQGVRADKLLKGEMQNVTEHALQKGGLQPMYSNLFKPSLSEWMENKKTQNLSPSGLIYEGDLKVPTLKNGVIQEVADLSKIQYFYRESLHAELKGQRANEILKFTHAENGKVYVSTTIDKVYPKKEYTDELTQAVEHNQCIDVLTRITVTNVPIINNHGLKKRVDYWQDFKNFHCHSNSPTE